MTRSDRTAAVEALSTALTAPGRPSEAGGLAPALEAFRLAAGAAETERRRARTPVPRYKAVLVGVLTGLLLLAGGTGAAQQGAWPDPVQQIAHSVLGRIGVRTPGHHAYGGGHGRSKSGQTGRSKGGPRPSAPTSSPDTGDVLLRCQVLAGSGYDLHSKEINPAVRAELAAAAGGESKIVPFCVSLLTAAGLPVGTPPATAPTGPGAVTATRTSPP